MRWFWDILIIAGIFLGIILFLANFPIGYEDNLKETCEGYYCGTYSWGNYTCVARDGKVIDFRISDRAKAGLRDVNVEICSESSCCDWGIPPRQ